MTERLFIKRFGLQIKSLRKRSSTGISDDIGAWGRGLSGQVLGRYTRARGGTSVVVVLEVYNALGRNDLE